MFCQCFHTVCPADWTHSFSFISESITSSGKNNNRKTNLEALNYARTALHHVYSRIIVWYIQPPAVGGGGDLTDTHYAIWHFFSYKCVWLKKFYGFALLQCFFKRALWNFACVLIANGLWNCLLLSKCLRTHDITQKNYWVGLIPFLPLIRLVFLVSDCRICSFYFWEIELSVLATRLLQTLKWEGADCRQGPSSVQPANPPSPSLLHLHCQASFFFPSELLLHISSSEVFTVLGSCWQRPWTHGLFFLQLQMHSLSSTRTLGLRPVISPEQHTSQKSVPLFLSAYAQNPSSAPHRKSSRATEPSNPGALPISASRSRSCIYHYILL